MGPTAGGWWDLSWPLGPDLPVYPGDPEVALAVVLDGREGPVHLSALRCGTHSGTHVDAPAHVDPAALPFTAIPVDAWSGLAQLLDLPPGEGPVGPAELAAIWPSPAPERLLLRSANSAQAELAPPRQPLSLAAAEWLVAQGLRLVGTDAMSIEADETGALPVHHALLGAGVQLVEGLHLAGAPAGPGDFVCLPLRLLVPDGAPARAMWRPQP